MLTYGSDQSRGIDSGVMIRRADPDLEPAVVSGQVNSPYVGTIGLLEGRRALHPYLEITAGKVFRVLMIRRVCPL